MFLKIYKTTFKNIFRSPTFWMLFGLFAFIAWDIVNRLELYGESSFSYTGYVQHVSNTMSSNVLYYAMPLFTVITTVIVLNRDHGDNFFEIEKAAGVSPAKYVVARLLALFTLNFIVATIVSYFYFHLYVFKAGGGIYYTELWKPITDTTPRMGLWEYIVDSTPRMMRMIIFRAVPTIVLYIGLTYCIGSLFKSGIVAAIGAIGYVIFYAACELMLRFRVGEIYWQYLSPNPEKLLYYFHYYDSDAFEEIIERFDTSLEKAAFCICLLTGLGIIYSLVAYICTKVRDR